MKLGRILTLGAAFLLCGASAALAGPKYLVSAPAIRTFPGPQTLFCDLVNLDAVNQDVIFEVMDYNGVVTAGPMPILLAPNNGFYLADYSGNGAWCRFTVNASTKKFRGIAIYDDGTTYVATIPAY